MRLDHPDKYSACAGSCPGGTFRAERPEQALSTASQIVRIRGAQRIGSLHPVQVVLERVEGIVADFAAVPDGEQGPARRLQGHSIGGFVSGTKKPGRTFMAG